MTRKKLNPLPPAAFRIMVVMKAALFPWWAEQSGVQRWATEGNERHLEGGGGGETD